MTSNTTSPTSQQQNNFQDVKIDVRCGICLNLLIKPVTFPCKHEVCLKCFDETMEKCNMNCPFCRKRLSIWSRSAVKLKTLINESKWQEICSLFPAQVRKAMEARNDSLAATEDEGEDFDDEVGQIKRILSQPGEILQEFKEFLKKEEQLRHQEKEQEEKRSLEFIQENFKEETEQSLQEKVDMALALSLQEQFDQEASIGKKRRQEKEFFQIKDRPKRLKAKDVRYAHFFEEEETEEEKVESEGGL